MKPIRTFAVIPSLPPALGALRELALNLRWSWNHDTIELFRRLDSDLWEATGHNPFRMLGTIDQSLLEAAAQDEAFLAHLDHNVRDLESYLSCEGCWYRRTHGLVEKPQFAYFSAEFGVTECLSIFAGGLGVLAGDHLKSASDLGLPLVGVGLLYQEGYFRQYLNEAGWQQEAYEDNDFHNLPLQLERRPDGTPIVTTVQFPDREVHAQVWRAQVGRIALYLLDTNIAANTRQDDRDITDQLYGGDVETRLKQEIILGIGGYRALAALDITPNVFHMNEGHSAFLSLERVRDLMRAHGLTFAEAREAASAALVFSTHTPVPAGHDYFPPELIDRYLGAYRQEFGLSRYDFLALGRQNPDDDHEGFCMTVLALRLAAHSNGVSKLHGQVSRKMWQRLWPGVPENEIPIGHVTNGVHFRSWISREMEELYDRYLGPRWREEPADQSVWQRAERIPAEELWRTHERRRGRLVSWVRHHLPVQRTHRGVSQREVEAASEALNPETLTIGFARRFATYKRATLLLHDVDRLATIVNNPERPVQLIFAGKAHPRDDAGKEFIRQIVALARQEPFQGKLVFLEDYDMGVTRYLVQGADVWLNTPRRPREASGTSGMKAAANGVLNLSVPDGWWDEAWEGAANRPAPIGWTIGKGETYEDADYQDGVEAETLYDLLEQDVIPTFYSRGADGLPRQWIARMRASIATLCYRFNTHRMVREYTDHFYLLAAARFRHLMADGGAQDARHARALAAWRARVEQHWREVRVESVDTAPVTELPLGIEIDVRVRVALGALAPEDIVVQLYLGRVDANGDLVDAESVLMQPAGDAGPGRYYFEATTVPAGKSGLHGYTVRVLPFHPDLTTPFLPGLIAWA
jgi:starch phosphorylase